MKTQPTFRVKLPAVSHQPASGSSPGELNTAVVEAKSVDRIVVPAGSDYRPAKTVEPDQQSGQCLRRNRRIRQRRQVRDGSAVTGGSAEDRIIRREQGLFWLNRSLYALAEKQQSGAGPGAE